MGRSDVMISVGAVLLLLFWSTWLFVLTARHVLRCHHGLAPPTLLFYLLILPSHLHSILSSLSPVFKMPSYLLFFFLSVRKHLFCSSDYLSAVVLADFVLLYFSSTVGLALLFLHPFFYTLTCLHRTLVGSLPWFFTVRVLVSSRHPSRSSLLASSASPGSQRRLFIAFSPPLCPDGSAEAGLCSARRGSELLAIGECQLVDFWDWVFGFRCIIFFYFSPAVGFRSHSWPLWIQRVRSLCDQPLLIKELFSAIKPASSRPQVRRFRLSQPRWRN